MIQIEQVRIQNKIIQKNFNQTSKNFYQSATDLLVKKNNADFCFCIEWRIRNKINKFAYFFLKRCALIIAEDHIKKKLEIYLDIAIQNRLSILIEKIVKLSSCNHHLLLLIIIDYIKNLIGELPFLGYYQ
ncbi:unnamed protein product [Paramecium pentaurelia]|uniref:Uncharacterized protein n=1 Tax=Paramecium pentaurelia TaxID=43138 RepID=A0A8S1XF61_9CILI|nr:unnamed protein product [Paramecium pentaurelia]